MPSPPPAPVGQPLLDTQEKSEFDSWIDNNFNTTVPSVDPSHLFAPDLQNDSQYWPDMSPSYQASDLSPHHGYLSNNMDGYLASNSVSSAPSMVPPPQININPFASHDLLQRQHEHSPPQLNNSHSLLNFGTDTNFAPTGYHPPPPVVQLDKDGEIRSKIYTAFSKNDSAVTTAVNSPAEIKYERMGEDTEEDDDSTPYYRDDDNTPSPSVMSPGGTTKRRIDGMDDFMSKSRKQQRPRKLDASARAAKKKAAGAKRDNLSEAQKRENHIHSEQKRRNLIRQGFEELCSMVPELNSGGYSKSAVLMQAANYLDDLKKGNARLRIYLQQLQQMDGRGY